MLHFRRPTASSATELTELTRMHGNMSINRSGEHR